MKNLILLISTSAILALPCIGQTPKQLATQRWYAVRQGVSFKTTGMPLGMVYDGDSLWVGAGLQLVKMRPGDGSVLASYPQANQPGAMTFDGATLWIANPYNANLIPTITRVQARDGAPVGAPIPLPTCGRPNGMAFDGTYVWAACMGDSSIYRFESTGLYKTFKMPAPPSSLLFDGSSLWVGGADSSVLKVDPTNGGVLAISRLTGMGVAGLAFDGTNIYATACTIGSVFQLNAAAPAANPLPFAVTGACPLGAAFDGANVWVSNFNSNTVSKLVLGAGGVLKQTLTVPVGAGPNVVVFDGADIWVGNNNSATLSKL